MTLLKVENLSISFGGLKAVQGFGLNLERGGLYGLIGPNGAGKTTVFNLLTGVYRPQTGTIKLDGVEMAGRKPHEIAVAGLSRTFQNIRLFQHLSVLENVLVASHLRGRHTLLGTMLRTSWHARQEREVTERGMELLELFGLASRSGEMARNLPYGDQRRLEIARALATRPKVLLLDEPAAGMNPQEKKSLRDLIRGIMERFGLTVLLIEHDMGVVMDVCQRITVLDHGCVIAEGLPGEIQSNPKVIEAYLGVPEGGVAESARAGKAS